MKEEAVVSVLTAEVKTLMIGSRQVTLSIWNQLDQVHPDEIIPFGRVADGPGRGRKVTGLVAPATWVVGKHKDTGKLVSSYVPRGWSARAVYLNQNRRWIDREKELEELDETWEKLDLIVLAGLR